MTTIEPIQHDPSSLEKCRQLFAETFQRSSLFSLEYLNWLYKDNPDGAAIGFNAWDSGRLVAHYACIPAQVEINQRPARAMLSLNTATHPSHRGRGLFLRLAEATYEAAANQGVQAVYGVANAQSTPGFTRKLGFQLARPLEARIGVGPLVIDWEKAGSTTTFRRLWNDTNLNWRVANPSNSISILQSSTSTKFFARARPCLSTYAEIPSTSRLLESADQPLLSSPFRLYLGLVPDGACNFSRYFSIPSYIRPSPLNFIYRPLTQMPEKLDPRGLCVSFLDFDAF